MRRRYLIPTGLGGPVITNVAESPIAVSGTEFRLRPYRVTDASDLQRAADDIRVARYMFAGFPHPYTASDADRWVKYATTKSPVEDFVIEVDGVFAGAIGLTTASLGHEGVGIIGYWLAPEWWGRGIVTEAVRKIVEYGFANGFRRIQSSVYEPNIGSARVMEKNGFTLEGRLRKCRVGRDGEIMDELFYGRLREDRVL
jgi:RimJ/RimL family protein N-acetyltransferase